jgi:hypothetical protein
MIPTGTPIIVIHSMFFGSSPSMSGRYRRAMMVLYQSGSMLSMALQGFFKPFQFLMDGLKAIVDVILTDITLINQKHDVVEGFTNAPNLVCD